MLTASIAKAKVQPLAKNVKDRIATTANAMIPANMQIGKIAVDSATVDDSSRHIVIGMNENFGYIPFDKATLANFEAKTKAALGAQYKGYRLELLIDKRPATDFLHSTRFDYTANNHKDDWFIFPLDDTRHPTKGLDGKIIAMWQSHGWYFEQKANRWQWQRARIFQTVEDLYTQSFVMPFLMPMLENAGAYVMSPRERDINTVEIIVDNDGSAAAANYTETNADNAWTEGGIGFKHDCTSYEGFDNPFKHGTFRKIETTKSGKTAKATWSATIPQAGKYAVYVSYATLPNSANDATYTIHSAEGDRAFRVNQTMGGSTWIYLGHFYFDRGEQTIVELTNHSQHKNAVITADAVKIGGGMGNIARRANDEALANVRSSESDKPAEVVKLRVKSENTVSGYPRFTEAARYWLQWAGIPDSIYSPSNGANDYTDDYRCRGLWVNYLAGGSKTLPHQQGLNIPVDLSFAFHSDAGTTMDNTTIGTLGIYSTAGDTYANGTDRFNSHKLTDYVLTNITNDVRTQFDSSWTRRGMWDKSYFEARVPEVPAMLLELLSHQNLADMRYGLDPSFRFTVSRAIYKGIAEFFADVEGRNDYQIQPLPVNSFAIAQTAERSFKLSWKPTVDEQCSRAEAKSYIVFERIGDSGFRQIATTDGTEYAVEINDNLIHSYQIVARNDGGNSFPSETLALAVAPDSKGTVAIVNGFTRISAPDSFDSGEIAGFRPEYDNGVPYINDINYIGAMFEFRRELPWISDDSCGFGSSRADKETEVIAGNTFDFAYIHGESILAAGYSFVSSSLEAVENGDFDLSKYPTADLILGKQKTTVIGRGEKPDRFAIFSGKLQRAVTAFCNAGGNIFVSGAYVASDVWDNKKSTDEKKKFAQDVLGYKWVVGQAAVKGNAHLVPTYFDSFGKLSCNFAQQYNDRIYAVESPDALQPANTDNACTLLRYDENNISAGIAADLGTHKTCVIGFPFETITDSNAKNQLMCQILKFFNK